MRSVCAVLRLADQLRPGTISIDGLVWTADVLDMKV